MTKAQRDILRKKRVLEHAERIGNIRKACRYYGVSRSAFYLWKKAYEVYGDEGLVFTSTSLGYIAMLYVYVAQGTFRDLKALRPTLQGSETAYAELRQQLSRFERRRLWVGGFLGFAWACVFAELYAGLWTQRIPDGESFVCGLCNLAISIGFWITAGRGTVYLIDSAHLYSQIGERYVAVNLLDLAPLSPLTRHGLRIVLLVTIITAAVVIYTIVDTRFRPSPVISPMITMAAVCLLDAVVAIVAFVFPVRGLRRQIRARKAEELAKVREDIRMDHELVAQRGAESAEAGARLPGLLAYKHEIESLREWPFDAPTLTRFFLYVAIPLGSWVGGALVERLLGAALD